MLDTKDRKILNLLQRDSRMSLTEIAKQIQLSIDATHKRIKHMQQAEVFYPTVLVNPRKIGYPLTVDVKVKLKDIDKKRYDQFVAYLCEHPHVISVFSASGEYDLTLPLMARDYDHLDKLSLEIRQQFRDIIDEWKSAVNLKFFKYERYDMERL